MDVKKLTAPKSSDAQPLNLPLPQPTCFETSTMSFEELQAVRTAKVAGPLQQSKSRYTDLPSISSLSQSTVTTPQEKPRRMCNIFSFIKDTYRDLQRFISGLQKGSIGSQLMQTINKYKNGCKEIFEKALESHDLTYKLAQNIVATMDILKELYTCLSDLEEYNYRLSELMSIYILCELRLSVDANKNDQLLIAHRIIYTIRKHLVQEEENESLYNILRTLVYIPKFYNARDIMCAIFGEFIPVKPVPDVNVLPDKLYILYIIVFYRWMMMQKEEDDKLLIINFAESFMKPSVSLCSNNLYSAHLPVYTTHSTATRTILNNLNNYYWDIRNASIIDNALKPIGAVNLCDDDDDDDDDDDIIIVRTYQAADFGEIFSSAHLEPLSGSMANIKLEEITVVDTVDLTGEEELINPIISLSERHDKWLNDFKKLAQQYRESQFISERQQLISSGENEAVISLDSDTEEEDEISAVVSKKTSAAATATQQSNSEDLFADNYPLTNISDMESLDADEDANDVTKISPRFSSGTLRTYEHKKSNLIEREEINNSNADEENKSQDMDKIYRRDSIHISSPPEETQSEEDEGTDVQDEHDDLLDEEEEIDAYDFLPKITKSTENEVFPKQMRPMGPYPTYNNMHNDKVVFSQTTSPYPQQQQQYKDKQYYYSDSSLTKSPKKQKKKVQFNKNPLGPTASSASQKTPLKPLLQRTKYKVSDAPEYFHLRGFERFSYDRSNDDAASTIGSNSTTSSTRHQDHLEAARIFFRQYCPGQLSPSLSSVSSRSLTSSVTPLKELKKSHVPNNKKTVKPVSLRRPTMGTTEYLLNSSNNEELYSIIRNREMLNNEYHSTDGPGMSIYGESSDDYYGVSSDADIIKERYNNDAKLRKRCAVVITHTKEMLQYERNRAKMYNAILQKQRRKLELRALEKRREKERMSLGRWEEKRKQTQFNNSATTAALYDEANMPRTRNFNEISMSSESNYETSFELRTQKPRQQNIKELEPLKIQIATSEATTSALLRQIESHLDKPASEKHHQQEQRTNNNDINQQTCDVNGDISPVKMSELNLLADIAQHLSPYQLDLPENNNLTRTSSPALELQLPSPALKNLNDKDVPKEKITITEQLIIQSLDNLLEKRNQQLDNNYQQQQASASYAHEPKLNTAAIFKSSPCANLLHKQNLQNNTQLESNDNNIRNCLTGKQINPKTQSDETLKPLVKESISVLKFATSPYNPSNDCTPIRQQVHNDSTIPIIISNVESLNQYHRSDDVAKRYSDNNVNLLLKHTQNRNSENLALVKNELINKETNEKTKAIIEEHNRRNEPAAVMSSNILNNVESTIICAGDLANISKESEISRNPKVASLVAADLSNISLESEMSKNLPEIAEPSPVVTDMSDNSNESDESKSFGLHMPINSNSNSATNMIPSSNEISVLDLSLVMPNMSQTTTLPVSQTLESSFNQLNYSLNTPTKLAIELSREKALASKSKNDLNTPLKFAVQTELESSNMPLKNTLEPETDNKVTKFLDLILNKTVTDAESETRDKIIRELNALTEDTADVVSDTSENICNADFTIVASNLNGEKINKSLVAESKTMHKNVVIENATDLNQDTNLTTDPKKFHQALENSSSSHKENNSTAIEISESRVTIKEQNDSQTPSANDELNPPKANLKETHTRFFTDNSTAELPATFPANSSSHSTETKSLETEQLYKIRCRVRLKRVNIDDHCRLNKNESWMVMPITKPIGPVSSNTDIIKCDNATVKTLPIKKPCLKHNNKHAQYKKPQDKITESFIDETTGTDVIPAKKPKLEVEKSIQIDATQASMQATPTQTSQASSALINNNTTPTTKSKGKSLKTVTFDLSNLNEELRDSIVPNHKQKSKSHAAYIAAGALGCYLKSSKPSRKLPDNTLRAAETLQLYVNTINDSIRTPPLAEFNRKRSPIKNKCIAEDETPRPPPASTLMGTLPCKKTYTEKARSQIATAKCKDQLVSSLTTPSISNITSDITTARIYTSSPLDQTLPEYDDNVDTVADSELILPPTTGSLRRKLKRPKKALLRPEPTGDISTDDISNQPECNGEDDTDAVVDNEVDVFAEELLPIPTANEHILEEIVSARPSHIGTGSVIRDDYMNIEATATVPVYLFNDESRDLGSPELIQSSDTNSVVDSSSYIKTSSSISTNNAVAVAPTNTTPVMGNLGKLMLSPSEHEVSSTQETFYQTPTKNKQTEIFVEKSATSKEKGNGGSGSMTTSNLKQKPEDKCFKNKEEYQTSSNIGLLQNNQVDTTNHSPEMCTLALAATTTTATTLTSNRKIRKASTHDEILFNELQQQQLPPNKRKSNTTFCVESTSDNKNNAISKIKVVQNKVEDIKSNGSLAKADDKFKKLLKEVCKKEKTQTTNELDMGLACASNIGGGGGGSSPTTTTTIMEEKLSRSKRKKRKSSKSSKLKSQSERCSKIVLKASKLTPHIPANPLLITIPKSRKLNPPSTPPLPPISKHEQKESEFLDTLKSNLLIDKDKATITTATQNSNNQYDYAVQYHSMKKTELINTPTGVISKPKNSQSILNISPEFISIKPIKNVESDMQEETHNRSSTTAAKEKSYSNTITTKKKENIKGAPSSITTGIDSKNNNLIFVKDKYDLIKSKEKYHQHRHHHHDHHDNKEKSKGTKSSQLKSTTSNNTRLHKSSSKEKIKRDKAKGKHKGTEKITANHQTDNILKPKISQLLSSSSSNVTTSSSTTSFTTNYTKQKSGKSNKKKSSSSSSSSLLSDILKSKTNLSITQSAPAATTLASSQITTATPSTNNVRKKLKIK